MCKPDVFIILRNRKENRATRSSTMKRFLVLIIMTSLFCFPMIARGNVEAAEKITMLEGIVELQSNPGDKPTIYLVSEDGTKIELLISEAAMEQARLQNREKIRIEGVFLGRTSENTVQEKLFARVMIRNQERLVLKDPVQLSEQEKTQVRALEKVQEMQQVQQMNQVQTEQGSKEGNPDGGSPAGSSKGKN